MSEFFLKIVNMSISASCDCGFDIAVLLEKSSQMGKCSALGHCRCADGFPVFD